MVQGCIWFRRKKSWDRLWLAFRSWLTTKRVYRNNQKIFIQGKVLDLGCGQGRHTIFCAEQGYEAYGIDYVERAIEEAKEKARKKHLTNAHFKVNDVLNLDFPENYFDIIIDWSTLDHIKYTDWPIYLKNILKVLKINGFLILSEFSAKDTRINNETIRLYKHKNKPFSNSLYFENEHHYDHYFNEDEIRNLFSKNFEMISTNKTTKPRTMISALMRRNA